MPSNQYNSSYTGSNHDTYVTKSQLVDLIYPVGSIYISLNNTNPTALFGGSWEAVQDRFLLGAGNNYNGNTTGGATSTTSGGPSNNTSGSTAITIAQMPSHNHPYQEYRGAGSGGTGYVPANSHANSIQIRTDINGIGDTGGTFTDRPSGNYYAGSFIGSTGGGGGHTHTLSSHTHTTTTMPPYLAVYMWKRVA